MATDQIAAKLLSDLKRDFGLTDAQAAGVVGNLMHESGGFNSLQEVNPSSGRGGFGYAQWTGDRRKSFESYAEGRGLDPSSYEANYGYLKHELETDPYERRQFNTVKKAQTAEEAARLVSENFLRPGKPNLASRQNYANQALRYANSPVPPGDIPSPPGSSVASQLSVSPRVAPSPNNIPPTLSSSRQVTSPTGGNSSLQSALNNYATREANRVTPASADDRVNARNRAWIANTPATTTNVASIPSVQSLTQPGAINASVNSTQQDPVLAAALMRRSAVPAITPTSQQRASDTALMRSANQSQDSAYRNGPVVASIPSRTAFNGDPGTPASGPVIDKFPTAGPTTRTVATTRVTPSLPKMDAIGSMPMFQGLQDMAGARFNANVPDRLMPGSARLPANYGEGIASQQLAQIGLPSLAPPQVTPQIPVRRYVPPVNQIASVGRVAPVPYSRPTLSAPQRAVSIPPTRQQASPLRILVQGGNVMRQQGPAQMAAPVAPTYHNNPIAFGAAAVSQSGDQSVGNQLEAAQAIASGNAWREAQARK